MPNNTLQTFMSDSVTAGVREGKGDLIIKCCEDAVGIDDKLQLCVPEKL